MTQPDVHALDQAVLDAGETLTRLRLQADADPQDIADARAALVAAMNARWPNG